MKKKVSYLLICTLWMAACSPEPKFFDKDGSRNMGPTGHDKVLSLPAAAPLGLFWSKDEMELSSDKFFETIEHLMSLTDFEQTNDAYRLKRIAHELSRNFYEDPQNFSKMTPENNLYVGAALGLFAEDLRREILTQFEDVYEKTNQSFDGLEMNIPPPVSAGVSLKETFTEIQKLMVTFPKNLKQRKLPSLILSAIEEQIPVIVSGIKKLLPHVSNINENSHLENTVTALEEVVNTLSDLHLLPDSVMRPLRTQVEVPKLISERLKVASSANDILFVLVEIYLLKANELKAKGLKGSELSSELKKELPENMHKLIDVFVDLSDKEIRYIQTTTDSWSLKRPILAYTKSKILDKLSSIGVDALRVTIDHSVSMAVQASLDSSLREQVKTLPNVMKNEALMKIVEQKGRWSKNFEAEMKTLAQKELKKSIFEQKEALCAVEKPQVYLRLADQKIIASSKSKYEGNLTPGSNKFLVSAAQLGSSLSMQAKRIAEMNVEGSNYQDVAYYQTVFSQINKLLAIGGFRDMYGNLISEAHYPITKTDRQKMDIYIYDIEKGIFAVPDLLLIEDGYLLKTNSRGGNKILQMSVGQQAEILRGTANMMNYFKSWKPSTFDLGFANLEYNGTKVFPKDAFFDLSLGIAAVVLRNLQKEGLVLFDRKGDRIELNGKSIQEAAKDAVSVAMVDVNGKGSQSLVKSADVARFILAIQTFLEVTEGVENSSSNVLNAKVNGVKENMEALLGVRKVLSKLALGLANFITNQMQTKEGGVVRSYSVLERRVMEEIQDLESQFLVMRALNAVYKIWGGEVYKYAATDIYYYLNSHMYDATTGFYKSQSDQDASTQKPYLVSMALHSIAELKQIVISSKPMIHSPNIPQMESLINLWGDAVIRPQQQF